MRLFSVGEKVLIGHYVLHVPLCVSRKTSNVAEVRELFLEMDRERDRERERERREREFLTDWPSVPVGR